MSVVWDHICLLGPISLDIVVLYLGSQVVTILDLGGVYHLCQCLLLELVGNAAHGQSVDMLSTHLSFFVPTHGDRGDIL